MWSHQYVEIMMRRDILMRSALGCLLRTARRWNGCSPLLCAPHAGQFRTAEIAETSTPYIMHPLRVAGILAEEWQHDDFRALATSLLHDTLEDCPREQRGIFEKDIIREAGIEVYHAVETLTKPMAGPREVQAAREARYFAELRKSGAWVRLVKLADRVDNLRDALTWGNLEFWTRYSSETIGWHLFLARTTSPLAEEALFRALVEGERDLRGRPPVWADGYMIDPRAAAIIPEHIARAHEIIGMAFQGQTLIVGVRDKTNALGLYAARMAAGSAFTNVYPYPNQRRRYAGRASRRTVRQSRLLNGYKIAFNE